MPDEVSEHTLAVADGRTVAWTQFGPDDGIPLVRMPGTPGGRWSVRGDRAAWTHRGLRVITTERPGFGASTRLSGRGFAEHAHDVAAVLDHIGVNGVLLTGEGGGAPHTLAFAALHPDRVRAVTVVAGAAPTTDAEALDLDPVNVRGRRLARQGDADGVRALLEPLRAGLLADPLAGFVKLMASSPEADQLVMLDQHWQIATARATRDALGESVDGWVDETLAVFGDWSDVPLGAVGASVAWWHAAGDRNASSGAAERLVGSLPDASFGELPEGHFAPYLYEPEILDELLARG